MKLEESLFWIKWRPKTADEMCLPQRIRSLINGGVTTNFIFYGPPGRGKTTLALVISQNQSARLINVGNERNLEELLDKLKRFCTEYNLLDIDKEGPKVVIFDEFERASKVFQETLRGFIEEHDKVRFIITTNNIHKMDPAIFSRSGSNAIDFTLNGLEKKEVREQIGQRMIQIAQSENITITVPQIKGLLKKWFPDLRLCIESLNTFKLWGETYTPKQWGDDLFKTIINESNETLWNTIFENYSDDIDDLWNLLGMPFFQWCRENGYLNKVPLLLIEYFRYSNDHWNDTDPVIKVLGISYIYKQIISGK
jgi:replication-associated recombination protein RarA